MSDIENLPTPQRRRFRATRSILALILREMSTTYGRSPGGYVWAVLEPSMIIFLLAFGFSLVVRTPSLGTSFILFYATGYLAFDMFHQTTNKVSRSLRFSKALLRYPAVSWIDAILARFFLSLITQSIVMCIVFLVIFQALEIRSVIDFSPILAGIAMAALLGLAVASVNCVLFGLYPIYDRVWSIVTRPLFLASGIIFIYEDLPTFARSILWWNPILHITGLVRTGFYPTYEASYVSIPFVVGLILALLPAGLLLLRRTYSDILSA